MSAEYAARMEVLQRRREELTAQRQAVEKRMALREATAAEFSAVALQSCRQKWKAQRSSAIAAQKRNDELARSVRGAQRQVHDACAKLQGDQSRSGALLAQEKARYNRRIEQVYPAWQEQLQRQRVQKLRELEDKKRAVERRRYLAKKSFEKEQTLDDLIRKTRHEVEMAENLEQNELYERELLRTQTKEVDQNIREVALEARSHLQQQAAKHLEMRPELDEELAEKLSETFSPRNTLRALREGSSSLAFEENQQYEEEKPARQIRVEIPARMNTPTRSYYPDVTHPGSSQVFYTDDGEFHGDYVDEIASEFDDRPIHFGLGWKFKYLVSVMLGQNLEPLGKLSTGGDSDEVDAANHETSSSVEGDTVLNADDVSTPTQPPTESSTDLPSEKPFETKSVVAESMDIKQTIEVAPRAPLIVDVEEDQATEEGPNDDKTSRIDSFHDTNAIADTRDTSITTVVTTPTLDTVENSPVQEAAASINDEVPAELPESPPASIAYATDLLEPFSPAASTPANAQSTENEMLLTSMQSDDFDFSETNDTKPIEEVADTKPIIPADIEEKPTTASITAAIDAVEAHASPSETPAPAAALEETITVSITEKLSPVDRVKALGALISRVEEGATEGDTLGGSTDTGSSNESKRDLLKMAVGGRKAQIAFFGSDICFELILDISRDLGPVLFPPKAFEGIMNDQKIRKLHQSNKEKQLDLWKALSGHLKQLVQLKVISSAALVDLFVAAFLAHDPDNQRSQRKLREFLGTVCGGGGGGSGSRTPSPRKETSRASPSPSPPKQEQRSSSPEPAKTTESEDRIGTPQLLQTAFLQRQSPPKPKVFGIASSSSFKDRSSGSSDVLASMSAGPMKLSQKLMSGGKMNDYSEFEEEEEVDLQNLIGTKSAFASASSSMGRGSYQAAKASTMGNSAQKKKAAVEEDDDSFDADF
ncbi:hypothetical protein PHYSODRAFT_321444 [Phytophthora sojae]|uniref:Uncharacterized protein n=1 Tax=Phytophthora sojae (strain P6497) TaxID=1094619 RepID=G4YGY5_PHYSP|nr:hypothetical protein PHYSODRAFT_321444 [Phytophthora sojae]EGZ27686.1 hypothetical protein PHYSODRAFT_321444 [Phytophthora sojae]|eukprot:XP_009514961.1 hypothetical protein PHYSODRAFT_321444 [Phytophthora sojae]